MKLDTGALRYLTSEDWRVLQAVSDKARNKRFPLTDSS